MVHLATVLKDSEAQKPPIKELENVKLEQPEEHELSATVYGSRFAAEGLPSTHMPEGDM